MIGIAHLRMITEQSHDLSQMRGAQNQIIGAQSQDGARGCSGSPSAPPSAASRGKPASTSQHRRWTATTYSFGSGLLGPWCSAV